MSSPDDIKTHNNESRGQEKAGRTQRTSTVLVQIFDGRKFRCFRSQMVIYEIFILEISC